MRPLFLVVPIFLALFREGAPAQDRFTPSWLVLPSGALSYEGKGAQDTPQPFWESKTSYSTPIYGILFRWEMNSSSALASEFWRNIDGDHEEANPFGLQSNQTRLVLNNFSISYQRKLLGSGLEALVGAQFLSESFDRDQFVVQGVPVQGSAEESLTGQGIQLGIHGLHNKTVFGTHFYADWNFKTGFLLHTTNRQVSEIPVLNEKGYTYHVQGELGIQRSRFFAGVGLTHQFFRFYVPGGKSLETGPVVSYSMNTTNFHGLYLRGGWSFK